MIGGCIIIGTNIFACVSCHDLGLPWKSTTSLRRGHANAIAKGLIAHYYWKGMRNVKY